MNTSKLEKKNWQTYFDRVSKNIGGRLAEIEVDSLALGSQIQAEWVPFFGITYDKKSDMVEVILEGMDHMIKKPKYIYVEQDGLTLSSVEIIDESDTKQIIKLRAPLMLPLH
jgi:hypothetical protein